MYVSPVYTGPRSGHKMHTLASTSKKWAPPSDEDVYSDLVHDGVMTLPPTPLSRSENIGEYLHACRPLVHCKYSSNQTFEVFSDFFLNFSIKLLQNIFIKTFLLSY